MSNEITAYFKGRTGVAESVYQYDYGRVLAIDGIDLPAVFEVHFNTLPEDDSVVAIGQNNRVAIPNICMEKPGTITAHFYLHFGDNDGETEYTVKFGVIRRAKPDYDEDKKSAWESAASQALALLQNPRKVNTPIGNNGKVTHGIAGQILRTKGNGATEWAYVGTPTDEQTEEAVNNWLDEHPEATTSVEDYSLTYNKLVKGTLGFVTPEMFGAIGDGITDDTEAIQSAIDAEGVNIVLFTRPAYLHSGILINNKTDLVIDGNGSVHTMDEEGRMFQMGGVCTNVVFKNFTAIGKTDQGVFQSFYSNASDEGNHFKNIVIRNNNVSNFGVGISVNADLGGTLDHIVIEGNVVDNSIGTDPGTGYGIHISDATNNLVHGIIRNNIVSNCQRHEIYVARGAGYQVYNNRMTNHREAIKSQTPAVALGLKRCKFVEAYGNQFIDCYDGHIQVSSERFANTEIYPHEDYMCEYIDIHDNIHEGDTNLPIVWIGYNIPYGDFSRHITYRNNISKCGYPIEVRYGYDITIKDNVFQTDADNYLIALDALPSEEEGVISDYYYVMGNRLFTTGSVAPLRLNREFLSNDVHAVFENNISSHSPMFIAPIAMTNAKTKYINQPIDGITFNAALEAVLINGKPTANPFSNSATYIGDLNDLHDAGFFFIGSSATNTPIASFGFLEVIGFYGSTTCVQRFTKTDASEVYYRTYINNNWNAWHQYTVSAVG